MLLASFFYGVAAMFGRELSRHRRDRLGDLPAHRLDAHSAADRAHRRPALVVAAAERDGARIGASRSRSFRRRSPTSSIYALIQRAGATNTILVTLLIPVGGVFLAWALLGEAFTPAEAAGMLLIGLGLVVIDGRAAQTLCGGRPYRRSQARPAP